MTTFEFSISESATERRKPLSCRLRTVLDDVGCEEHSTDWRWRDAISELLIGDN
jgi:hypothetical protein